MLEKIVAFSGCYGSGKSYTADLLESYLKNKGVLVHRLAFSDLLKDNLGVMLKSDFRADKSLKNDSVVFNDKIISVRHLMQSLGDIMREINKGVFCKALNKKAHGLKGVLIIDDLRFFNEALCLVGLSKRLVFVMIDSENDNAIERAHSSENYETLKKGIKNYFSSVDNCALSVIKPYKQRDIKDNELVGMIANL